MLRITAGGSADQRDVDLVAAEYAHLPADIAMEIDQAGLDVVACRDSVVDFRPQLRGVRPDGWPEGATWDSVPGAYLTAQKTIVVATIPDGAGGRRVPRRGEGHGSWSLAIHELLHGFDQADDTPSKSRGFRRAWTADAATIGQEPGSIYFLNATWGPREAYAESGARRFGLFIGGAPIWPALSGYWQDVEPRSERDGEDAMPPPFPAEMGDHDDFIGSAYRDGTGSIILNLFAHDADGIEGHGLVILPDAMDAIDVIAPNMIDMRTLPMADRLMELRGRRAEEWLVRPFR